MYYCIVCDKESKSFSRFGLIPRYNAKCPNCGSLERHRLTFIFLKYHTNLFDNNKKNFLHVAPEPQFIQIFSELIGDGYLTCDIEKDKTMEQIDITNIKKENNSFDAVYCSHVLEHVLDDKTAMKEFYRIMKHDGWAILNVPINSDKTFEDKNITSPKDRERIFGQWDHVRRYGPDYKDRLEDAGFIVSVFRPQDLLTNKEIEKHGLFGYATGDIFYCTK